MGSTITQIPQLLSSVNAIQPVSNTTPNTIGTSSGPLTGSGVAYPSNTINILGGALAPTPTTNSIDPMDQMYLDLYGFNPYQLYGYPSFIDYNEAKQKNQGNAELEDYLGMLQSAQRLGVNVPNKVGFQELSNLITKAQTTNTAPPPITAGPSMTPYQQQAMSEILSKFGVSSLNDLRNNFKMNISGSGLPGSSSARIGPSVNTYTYTNPEAAIAARAKQLADEAARVKVNMAGYRPGARNGGRIGYADAGIVSLTDENSGVIYRDEKGKPISKEQAMKLFAKQAEEESSEENNKDDKLNAKFDLAFKISKRKNMSLKDALDLITDQMKLDETYIPMLGSGSDFIKDRIPTNTEGSFKNGGIIGLMNGGTPIEMDYRGGGFIPIGAEERADDVPARLSKNEFVMTADAVRAAGGGSVNEGARRMYQLMNALEGRIV